MRHEPHARQARSDRAEATLSNPVRYRGLPWAIPGDSAPRLARLLGTKVRHPFRRFLKTRTTAVLVFPRATHPRQREPSRGRRAKAMGLTLSLARTVLVRVGLVPGGGGDEKRTSPFRPPQKPRQQDGGPRLQPQNEASRLETDSSTKTPDERGLSGWRGCRGSYLHGWALLLFALLCPRSLCCWCWLGRVLCFVHHGNPNLGTIWPKLIGQHLFRVCVWRRLF